ncbi:MAG TPA: hypothetical protein VGL23_18200 [Chloroflexota bacterium]
MAVTRFEVRSRRPLPGFDYERLDGRLHFAVDPEHRANRAVVDLDRAARDADGPVRFASDLTLLRPADRGSRRLLVDVVNRGRRTVLRAFNRAPGEAQPSPEVDSGDVELCLALAAERWEALVGKPLAAAAMSS